jgi:hypothetical protein
VLINWNFPAVLSVFADFPILCDAQVNRRFEINMVLIRFSACGIAVGGLNNMLDG